MELGAFFSSPVGAYVTQTVVHAFIAALITDRAINAWEVRASITVQRFRLIVIVLPIVSFPAYQLINPGRGSLDFRMQALFDSQRWLNVELWGKLPISAIVLFIVGVTVLLFLGQELIPVAMHSWSTRKSALKQRARVHPPLAKLLDMLPGEKPPVVLLDEEDHVVFSTVGRNSSIYLSSGLLEVLTPDELRAAVAHEIAHITRSRRPLLIGLFVLRALMFYNPVTLLEFRKIVHEEEKICDDLAVELTGNGQALAATLRKLYGTNMGARPLALLKPGELRESLEEHGHRVLLEDRIKSLEERAEREAGNQWLPFVLTAVAVSIINYFVV